MAQQLDDFKVLLNGNLSRSDQAFLVNALTLSAAISGTQAVVTQPTMIMSSGATNDSTTVVEETLDESEKVTKRTTTKTGQPPGTPINPPSTEPFTIPTPNFQQQTLLSNAIGFGGVKTSGIGLEPVEELNQLKRYLDHLNQIRRQNEGDDVSDSPGYSINLVRIPVSILPGKKTREGYGAEITITATPVLSEETLPRSFREWVINDLVDELTIPTLRNVDLETWKAMGQVFRIMKEFYGDQFPPKKDITQDGLLNDILDWIAEEKSCLDNKMQELNLSKDEVQQKANLYIELKNQISRLQKIKTPIENNLIKIEMQLSSNSCPKCLPKLPPSPSQQQTQQTQLLARYDQLKLDAGKITAQIELLEKNLETENCCLKNSYDINQRLLKVDELSDSSGKLRKILESMGMIFSTNALSRGRKARYSVPGSVRGKIYGRSFHHWNHDGKPSPNLYETSTLVELGRKLADLYQGKPGRIPNTVVREFLQEELKASYDLLHLRMKENPDLWRSFANQLYKAIRNGQDEQLLQLQLEFADLISQEIPEIHQTRMAPYDYQIQESLAWCILIEASLLNQKLYDDMNRIAKEKNCHCVVADEGMEFYLPSELIPFETKHAFNEYVKCRWPLKVFTIDPISQDQNIADSFSMRRELQLAASLAFANGKMSARNFSQYARKIALDSETIALNKTVVGFAHGDNTFGWRFRPRFQSPEIDGTVKTFFQTLAGGPSRDDVLKDHRLEPGIRECVAIIVAPGFVPYVTFDTRSNWYKLTKPKDKEFSLQDTVRLSRDIVDLRSAKAQCLKDEHLYREGEVYRLMRAVDQLEARLPLQTAYVEMPVDFSKGGFQALSGSLTSLGPELVGFYGEPGYNPKKENTSLFLVGDNFNIMDTKVIAGNTTINNISTNTTTPSDQSPLPTRRINMLSRQVLEVSIPKDLNTYKVQYDGKTETEVIGIRVATPYGVSNVLEIPVVKSPDNDAEIKKAISDHVDEKHISRYEWETSEISAQLIVSNGGVTDVIFANAKNDKKKPLLNLKNVSDPNLPKVFSPEIAQLAAWVEATKVDPAGNKTKLDKETIGPFDVDLSSKKNLSFSLDDLKKAIISAVPTASIQTGEQISSIAVTGYLRFHNADSAELPIFKLEKPLTIKPVQLKDVIRPTTVQIIPAATPNAQKQSNYEWGSEAINATLHLTGDTKYPVLGANQDAIIKVKKPTGATAADFKGWIFIKYNEFQTCRVRHQLAFYNIPYFAAGSEFRIDKSILEKTVMLALEADQNLPCQLKEIDEIRLVGELSVQLPAFEKVSGYQAIKISIDVQEPNGFKNPFAPQQ
ncbi:hypothetical protein [Gimesia chilikensis]|nr:hypothetical protein [Gimesia chilikensis]